MNWVEFWPNVIHPLLDIPFLCNCRNRSLGWRGINWWLSIVSSYLSGILPYKQAIGIFFFFFFVCTFFCFKYSICNMCTKKNVGSTSDLAELSNCSFFRIRQSTSCCFYFDRNVYTKSLIYLLEADLTSGTLF